MTVTAVADEYGVLTNDVTVGDKTASVDVTVPEIIPTKDVNNTAPNFGDKVEYTITLSNNGVVDAKQVVVVDTLDEGLMVVGILLNVLLPGLLIWLKEKAKYSL